MAQSMSPSSAWETALLRSCKECATRTNSMPGLMQVNLGGYRPGDIRFVAAFDIDVNKVGKDLSEAVYATPNNIDEAHRLTEQFIQS